MPIVLTSGLQVTNIEPVDSRFVTSSAANRNGLSSANIYEGLVVYLTDTKKYTLLVSASNPLTDACWVDLIVSSGSQAVQGGLIISGSLLISGSGMTLTGSLNAPNITGSLLGTASYITGSIFTSTNPALSASYALTASHALNTPVIDLSGYTTTSSFNDYTSSTNTFTQSANSSITSLNSFSQSINNWTSSVVTTSSFNAYTSSINSFTQSTNSSISSLNSFSESINSWTGSVTTTSSFNSFTSSINSFTSSINSFTQSANSSITALNSFSSSILSWTSSVVTTSSFNSFTSSINSFTQSTNNSIASLNSFSQSISNWTGSTTSQFAGTASWATSASNAINAQTASYLNNLNQNLTVTGDVTINGTASISFLNVTYESASVIYSSGSNQFGDATNDTQSLFGRVIISGSLEVTGSSNLPNITGSLFGTASYVTGSIFTSTNPALSSSYATTSSHALTASSADAFLIRNGVTVTGSVNITGSTTQIGNIALTGSIFHTGSTTQIGDITLTGSLLATQSYISKVDYIEFTSASDQPTAAARLGWNNSDGTLNLGLKGGNVNMLVGQAEYAYVYNAEATTLTKGTVVYLSGSQGNRIAVKRASDVGDATSAGTLGLAAESIASGATGFVIVNGVLHKVDTSAFTAGAPLYLSDTPGQLSQTPPNAPSHSVRIGYVERDDNTVGSIYVKIDNGYELDELHNVLINTASLAYGDLLMRDGNSVWVNTKTLSGSYTVSGSLTVTGSISARSLTASIVSASQFTGSLFGTASWAINAISSSYPIAGTGSNIYSTSPTARVPNPGTINSIFLGNQAGANNVNSVIYIGNEAGSGSSSTVASNFIGSAAGKQSGNSSYSNFIGLQAGQNATNSTYCNFIGSDTGNGATNAIFSNFIGISAGNSSTGIGSSNFLGTNAGANLTQADSSNFLGSSAGRYASHASASNFFGDNAGAGAASSAYSNFIGYQAGYSAIAATYSTFIGYQTGKNQSVGRNNIVIGTNIALESYRSDSINIGGIIFGTGSYFNVDATFPYTGSTNGKIGIDNTSPSFTLDVGTSIISASVVNVDGPNFTGTLNDATFDFSGYSALFSPMQYYVDITTVYSSSADSITSTFNGGGLNDATFDYTGYTGSISNIIYTLTVANANIPDEISWADDQSNSGTFFITAATPEPLSYGTTVTFASDAGHTIGDEWIEEIAFTITGYPEEFTWSDNQSNTGTSGITLGTPQALSYGNTVTFANDYGHALNDNWNVTASFDFTYVDSNGITNTAEQYNVKGLFFGTQNRSGSVFLGNGVQTGSDIGYSFFVGDGAGLGTSNIIAQSNFIGQNAGRQATNAAYSNFIGALAGDNATFADSSNFIGQNAGALATNANYSVFLGQSAGYSASNAANSIFIGNQAGRSDFSATGPGPNNIIIGKNITLADARQDSINIGGIVFGTGSYSGTGNPYSGSTNGRIGINVVNPQYNLDVSGSGNYTNGLTVTGSLTAASITGSFSGSVFGYVPNTATSSFVTNSQTASFATTGSNTFTGNQTITGNLIVSGNTTIGDATTDSITMNAATMSLGSGTGILNIDSNTLHVDGNNNRVGISKIPTTTLDISGTTTITGSLNVSGSTHTITGSLRATSFTGSLQGTASWAQNVSAAGSNTQIQYNNNGALAGSAGLQYDNLNQIVRVQSSFQFPLRVSSSNAYELWIGGEVNSANEMGIFGGNDEAIASFDGFTGIFYYGNGNYTYTLQDSHQFLNDVRLTDNLIVSGNVTLGNASTDNITMNAATMSLGSGTGILNIDSNTLFVDGNNNRVGIGTSTPSSRLDVSGSVVVSGSLVFNPGASPSFNGEIVRFGSGTLTRGQLYFLSSSGTWSLANANSTSSSIGMLGLAVGSSPTTDGLLIRGFAVSSSYTYGTGLIVYAATSSGLMTATSPSSSNHVVRVLGYQTTISNTIYFDPDKTWVTLA